MNTLGSRLQAECRHELQELGLAHWMLAIGLLAAAEAAEHLTCADLVPVRAGSFGSFGSPKSLDLRHLWPLPRHVALYDEMGKAAFGCARVTPLQVEPCSVPFSINLRGRGDQLLDAVIWSLRHFCWRLCSRPRGRSSDVCVAGPSISEVELEIKTHTGELPSLEMDESYGLVISTSSRLWANSVHGFRRGLETMLQIFDSLDRPRFPWRGLLLDTARHFIPPKAIESLLFIMAANKLNVLHWHLTDAMSFPLELKSLPQLAQLGSFGPNKTYPREVVQHLVVLAANFSIRIVPELDMPAHTASWIFGEPSSVSNCTHVLPTDPDAQNPFKARDKLALDLSNPRSREVAKTILREVAELFPDEFLHVGGDEVDYRCWTTMPHIQKWMRKRGLGPLAALQEFFDDVLAEVKRLGKRPVLWEDGFDQGLRLPKDAVVQPWKCWGSVGPGMRWWPKGEDPAMLGHAAAFLATELGLSAVQSSCWYLDWPSQWTDFYGHAADEGPLQKQPSKRLLGGEAALWTERVDFTNLACRAWPRSAAVAERLWSDARAGGFGFGLHAARLERLHGLLRPLRHSLVRCRWCRWCRWCRGYTGPGLLFVAVPWPVNTSCPKLMAGSYGRHAGAEPSAEAAGQHFVFLFRCVDGSAAVQDWEDVERTCPLLESQARCDLAQCDGTVCEVE
ncbi:unnamed protein product [Effrenium voratum]|nr:unnamed protein product [Effrenium voratum]